jgi:hypothetical protein
MPYGFEHRATHDEACKLSPTCRGNPKHSRGPRAPAKDAPTRRTPPERFESGQLMHESRKGIEDRGIRIHVETRKTCQEEHFPRHSANQLIGLQIETINDTFLMYLLHLNLGSGEKNPLFQAQKSLGLKHLIFHDGREYIVAMYFSCRSTRRPRNGVADQGLGFLQPMNSDVGDE